MEHARAGVQTIILMVIFRPAAPAAALNPSPDPVVVISHRRDECSGAIKVPLL